MKTNIFTLIFFVLVVYYSHAQNANQTLSNLKSPTAINQDLLPSANNIRSLGSSPLKWQSLYVNNLIVTNDANINGVTVGRGNANNNTNIVLGDSGLYNNTTGTYNTAIGKLTLFYNTTGFKNTVTGYQSLYSNTTGSNNTPMVIRHFITTQQEGPTLPMAFGHSITIQQEALTLPMVIQHFIVTRLEG